MEKPESFSELDRPRLMRSRNILRSLRVIMRSSLAYSSLVEKKTGISASQLWMLAEIASAPGMKVNDLARILAIHQSTCSNVLDKLQKKALIRRERNERDQRIVRLFPTEKGAMLLAGAPRPTQGIIADALLHLPDESLAAVEDGLGKLVDAMRFIEEKGADLPLDQQV